MYLQICLWAAFVKLTVKYFSGQKKVTIKTAHKKIYQQ